MKIFRESGEVAGHLTKMEVSRATTYLLIRRAIVFVELTSPNCRRSPLVQGGGGGAGWRYLAMSQ